VVPKLREDARIDYVKERKDKQLRLLEAEVLDEEFLFGEQISAVCVLVCSLSHACPTQTAHSFFSRLLTQQAERERLEAKKEVLRLAKEHTTLEARSRVDAYDMPTAYVDEKAGTRDRGLQQVCDCACVCMYVCVCVCVCVCVFLRAIADIAFCFLLPRSKTTSFCFLTRSPRTKPDCAHSRC
jgi:cell division protein FtsL